MKLMTLIRGGKGTCRLSRWALAALAIALAAGFSAPSATAQSTGSISGQIMDVAGKPWAEMPIQAGSDQGAKQDAKTDKDGK